MIKRDELITFINKTIGQDLLEKAIVKDEMANGVQFLGSASVEKVALGVSLNEEFLQQAVEWGADVCIFHHGFDVRTYKSRFPLSSQKRLQLIFKNGITVMGFHYALDAHPTLGNNAVIIKSLGAKIKETLFEEWGYTAVFDKPQDLSKLASNCEKLFNHEVFITAGGPEKVKTIGVVSGAGKPYAEHIAEMEAKGVELFITGETSESVPHKMQESGINYFACGHYATEVFGVKALGERIESKFGTRLKVEFINVPNPV
jgi:dinuclear metal center YbgI/SA1388 family protein